MTINLTVPENIETQLKPRISVIGVGGAGGNAVNNMIDEKLEGVEFIVANTDAQALTMSKTNTRIQLGVKTTQGLGSGARPEVGCAAAEEALNEIIESIEGSNMVFITAGAGGGTGSGAAPVIARAAKERGILTVGVVTKPFHFEGIKRMKIADSAVEELAQEVDTIIVIPNQNLFRIADKNTTLADAFKMADDVLYEGVRSVTDLMIMPGLINLDFADVKTIMENMGKAIMGTGEADGEERALKAAEDAISNPLLDDIAMAGAKGVLINISGGKDLTLFEVDEAANRIKSEIDNEANIIFGSCFDEDLEGKIRVSVVATGLGEEIIRNKTPKSESLVAAVKEEETLPHLSDYDENKDYAKEVEKKVPEFTALENPIIEDTPVTPTRHSELVSESQEDEIEEETTSAIPEMPSAVSFFNDSLKLAQQSIHKIDEDLSEEKISLEEKTAQEDIINSVLANKDEGFNASNTIQTNSKPEIFTQTDLEDVISEKEEEQETFIEEKAHSLSLIDIVTGRSIARRNKEKQTEQKETQEQEEVTLFSNNENEEKNEEAANTKENKPFDLDLPSFLRRSNN